MLFAAVAWRRLQPSSPNGVRGVASQLATALRPGACTLSSSSSWPAVAGAPQLGLSSNLQHRANVRRMSTAQQRQAMETWEEVEAHRPKAPTLEGYERPKGAPEQFDLTREQFHQYMRGKPRRYSSELRVFLTGIGVMSFVLAECAFTVYKMRPDDLSWIEEERQRAAAAKARIDARIAAQQREASSVE